VASTFGVCSIWHLAGVSAVKCAVIVRPLTHFTIFTDRVLRAIICAIWILSLVVAGTAALHTPAGNDAKPIATAVL